MNLPQLIQELVNAQNNTDSAAYANLFTENAKVFDEARTHTGKAAIKDWVEKTTAEYKTVMKPLAFEGDNEKGVLKTEVSGTFPGSPFIFTYNFEFDGEKIKSLEIS
ncbi:nuclear transport factor 2 family protein [Flavobacterium sp. DGU11]|uniref:Nuclear transport factor 2 family protein n=1 Tax=Flavobacterium arundinis TaxID=3139143 RepID=A0ABU9HS92_9FLAO